MRKLIIINLILISVVFFNYGYAQKQDFVTSYFEKNYFNSLGSDSLGVRSGFTKFNFGSSSRFYFGNLWQTGSGNNYFAGNFGLGTMAPIKKLHLAGSDQTILFRIGELVSPTVNYLDFSNVEVLMYRGENSNAGFTLTTQNAGSWGSGVNAGDIIFKPNNSEAMRIDKGGSVSMTSSISTYDSLNIRNEVSNLDSSQTIALATGVAGFGEVMIGDNVEWAHFRFSSDGTVTLISNTANVTTTAATAGKLNIYDGGSGVVIENNLVRPSKKVAINVKYYTP